MSKEQHSQNNRIERNNYQKASAGRDITQVGRAYTVQNIFILSPYIWGFLVIVFFVLLGGLLLYLQLNDTSNSVPEQQQQIP